MRVVKQEETDGCFVACAAMVLGVDYWTAKARLGFARTDSPFVPIPDAVRRLRRALGPHVRVHRTQDFGRMRRKVLAVVKWNPNYPEAHTVLWDGTKAHDPWRYNWGGRHSLSYLRKRTEAVIYV